MKKILFLNNRHLEFLDFDSLKVFDIEFVVYDFYYEKIKDLLSAHKVHIIPSHMFNVSDFHGSLPYEPVNMILKYIINKKDNKDIYIACSDEFNVLLAAKLRDEYKLYGNSFSLVNRYRNKVIQKQTLIQNNIAVPKFRELISSNIRNKLLIYKNLASELNIPFILKPQSEAASIGINIINSFSDFEKYLLDNSYEYLITEEFIDGQLYHCDLITENTRVLFAQSAEYLFNGLSFIKGKNHGSIPLEQNNPINIKLIEFTKLTNQILGLQNGCTHHEIFITSKGELIFLEAALRPPGSLVPEIYKRMFNVNLMNAALCLDSNTRLKVNLRKNDFYFWSIFPKLTGIIEKLNIPQLNSCFELKWFVKTSEQLSIPTSLSSKAGELIAHNTDYNQLYDDFNSLKLFSSMHLLPII